jgi:cyclic pyranopterin phosphate synthase
MTDTTHSDTRLTHTDDSGRARMVDVSAKAVTTRTAVASGTITMRAETLAAIRANEIAKGDVLGVARIAGVLAAKRTAELVPLCHSLPLAHVDVAFDADASLPGIRATATATTIAQTGVEMEAITAVAIALVTIYDMAKSADRAMVIGDVHLVSKTGGKSGDYTAPR